MADALPTADELLSSVNAPPVNTPVASNMRVPHPDDEEGDQPEQPAKPAELPTADELLQSTSSETYEKSLIPTLGRITKNAYDAAKEVYQPDQFHTPEKATTVTDKVISLFADPAAELFDTLVAKPDGAIFEGLTAGLYQAGEETSPGLGRDLAIAPQAFPFGPHESMGVPHPHDIPPMAAEAASHFVARVPEDVYMGTKEPTADQKTYADAAATAVKNEPAPTIHEVARQIAPDVFNEYDSLQIQRDRLGDQMRAEAENNRKATEEASPFTQQIADLQARADEGSKRQQKITQQNIEDLQEQHKQWMSDNQQPSAAMEQLRAEYEKADFRMRDLSPDVSAAYRSAQERIPELKPESSIAKPENKELEPREAMAAEAQTAKGELKNVLTRVAKAKPEKAVKDIKWANKNGRPDIVDAITENLVRAADQEAIKTHMPEGIAKHMEKQLLEAGEPAERAKQVGKLVEEHYKALSEDYKGKKGTPEELYARHGAIIKSGVKERAKELTQKTKDKTLFQSQAYTDAASRLQSEVSGDMRLNRVPDLIDRAARGELTPRERRTMSNSAISAARDLEAAHDQEMHNILFQPGDYGLPGFYSKMYRGLDEKLNASGTPEQMLKQIEGLVKNGAFKKDELYWSGLEDYLNQLPEPGKKVTKEQIMNWLDRNKLDIGEHLLDAEADSGGFTENDVRFDGPEREDTESENPSYFDNEVDHYVEMFHDEYPNDADGAKKYFDNEDNRDGLVDEAEDTDGEPIYEWDEQKVRSQAEDRARDYFSEYGDEVEHVSVGHGAHDYTIRTNQENGEWSIINDNGRIVDSGNSRHPDDDARNALWEHLTDNDIVRYSDDEAQSGETVYSDYQSEGPKDQYKQLLITLPDIKDRGVSQHGWPNDAQGDNILLHTRFNTRIDAEGKKTLFIEEIQSDWHQQGREKGYQNKGDRARVVELNEKEDDIIKQMNVLADNRDKSNRMVEEDTWHELAKERDILRREITKLQGGVAEAPFNDLNKYSELAMKRLIGWAAEHGYEKVAWTTGEQQAARWSGALQRHVQEIRISPESTPDAIKLRVLRSGGGNISEFIAKQAKSAKYDEKTGYVTIHPDEISTIFGKGLSDQVLEKVNEAKKPLSEFTLQDKYDAVTALEKARSDYSDSEHSQFTPEGQALFRKFGEAMDNLEKINQAFDGDSVISGIDMKISDKGMKEVYDKVLVNTANSIIKKFGAKVKASLLDTGGKEPTEQWSFDMNPELTKSANEGQALFQGARGKIRLAANANKNTITLFGSRNASTIIHELGHDWFEELLKNAAEPDAPEAIIDRAKTLREWAGYPDKRETKADKAAWTRAHERVARGFERYLMEGVAPSRELGEVFAKFKTWLTNVYKSVLALKAPITPAVRNVFDHMLSANPEKTAIAPEHTGSSMMADIHEHEAQNTPKEHASSVADNIEREIDKTLNLHNPEAHDAIKEAEAGRVSPETASSPENGTEQPEPAGGQRDTVAGGSGESEGAGDGNTPAATIPRSDTESPDGANSRFTSDTKFIDKAGNIRLDNLNAPEDVNQVLRDAAEKNSDFLEARRGVMSDGEVLTLAESLGMDPATLNRRTIGQAFNAEQIVAARKLLIQSATKVLDAGKRAAEGTDEDVMKYAEVRARHQMIQEQVAGITAEAGRALRAFRSLEGGQDAKAVGEILKQQTGKDLFQLKQEAQLMQNLDSPQKVSKFVNDSKNNTVKSMILEYYINALISGPITHLRYSVGNALNAVWTPLIETPAAAAFGALKGDADRVYLGEAGAQLHGLLKGSKDGLYAAATAFKTGVSPLLPGEHSSSFLSEKTNAIPGKIGKIINLPSKSVSAIHSFFKSIRYEQNIQALAYRTAMKEGLKDEAFVNRVSDLTTTPTEDMMTNATANALKELYMSPTDYHSAMGALTRFTNQSLMAKIIVPFMKIGSQITRNAFVERTPLGLASDKVRATLKAGGADRDFQLAKMATGVALMGTTALLASEGLATGDGPNDPEKRKVWLLSHTPNSIQIGGITLPYQGLGHLGMLMRFSANMYETASHWNEEDGGKLAFSFLESMNKSVLDENFMRGLKDMLDAVYHPEEYGSQYIKNFATNWLPFSVGMGQTARKVDPYQRETNDIFDTARAKISLLSEGLFPRRDMFGNPILNAGQYPGYAKDPVVQRMQALQIGVSKVEKKIGGVQLTPKQYDDYARISGKLSKQMLNNIITPNFAAMPPGEQIKIIKSTIEHARETARNMVKFNPANQNIMQQMIANKQAILKR